MDNRNYKLDNFRCILIFLTVFSHCIDTFCRNYAGADFIKYVNYWIYSFHMPAFVFISGYFSHLEKPKYFYNSISRFFVPYLLINTVEQLLTSNQIDPSTTMWTLWYLLSMFWWRALLPYVKHVRFSFFFFLIVALLAGKIDKIGYTFSLSRTVCFFPYFLAGYLIRIKNQKWVFTVRKSIILPVFVITSLCVIFLAYKKYPLEIFAMRNSYSTIGLTFTTGLALRLLSYVFGFTAILAFLSFLPDNKSRISMIGMYTYPIYILHTIILLTIQKTSGISIDPIIALFLSLFVSACMCFLFGNIYVNKAINKVFNTVSYVFIQERQPDSGEIQ